VYKKIILFSMWNQLKIKLCSINIHTAVHDNNYIFKKIYIF